MRDKSAGAKPPVEKRTALVIGNGLYQKVSPLDNPINDATDMAAVLQGLGFEVIKGTDANLVQMRRLIRDFGEKLAANKGIGLFYYAGHGVEVKGKNFLVPVDADISREIETEDYAIDVNSVMRQMDGAGNGFNIVILDACRNNPFSRGWNRTGDSGGLANINAPTGTFIAFAAAPGSTASDGKGTRNGIFTGALIKQLTRPDLKLEEVFKATRESVMQLTANKQVPWDSSSVKGDFYFKTAPAKIDPANATPTKSEPEPVITAKTAAAQEQEAWDMVKNSWDTEDFREFLKGFPSGINAAKAMIRFDELSWIAAKKLDNKAKVQAYLRDFPNGANAAAARILLRQIEARETAAANPPKTDTTATNQPATNISGLTAGALRRSPSGIEIVWIPPGEFMMGSSDTELDEAGYECHKFNKDCKKESFTGESPKHRITIKDGFWMGKYEVTQGQWQSIMGENPSNFTDCGGNCPVEKVSWDDIQIFLRRLNSKNDGFVYSLPSEAEWEYAARAGTTTAFAFGDSLNSSQANFNGNYPYNSTKGVYLQKTVQVGRYKPNAWGLYDMHGNVWEWAQDIYNSAGYSGLPTDSSANVSTGDSSRRVLRGGSWYGYGIVARSAYRDGFTPAGRNVSLGLRVAARAR